MMLLPSNHMKTNMLIRIINPHIIMEGFNKIVEIYRSTKTFKTAYLMRFSLIHRDLIIRITTTNRAAEEICCRSFLKSFKESK